MDIVFKINMKVCEPNISRSRDIIYFLLDVSTLYKAKAIIKLQVCGVGFLLKKDVRRAF